MSYIFITLAILLALALAYSVAKMVQIAKFSEYMHQCLDELYEGEKWKSIELDITRSYHNFDRSPAWNYKFQDMVVYESKIAA